MELKKILWPTDFSGSAEKALEYVTSLSEKYQTEVHVLYVIEELAHHESWYGEFDRSHIDKIHEWERQKAQERLDEICERYLQGCPLYIKHIAIGDPAQEILKLTDSEKIDMVIMASHGRKGYFHFGSVAEKVLKNSRVPVVTIPVEPNK
ncbi:MAG: universal stress protein [Desulfobacterales bacterium]|nr:universal stress protein [Desulfobacterales bacterium]